MSNEQEQHGNVIPSIRIELQGSGQWRLAMTGMRVGDGPDDHLSLARWDDLFQLLSRAMQVVKNAPETVTTKRYDPVRDKLVDVPGLFGPPFTSDRWTK
jgi:hypothetical protein